MNDFEVYGLVIIAMVLSFVNWRLGVLICLIVGFLQDPLRKLVPGEPVVFTALVAAPLLTTVLGAHLRKVRMSFRPLHTWSDTLRTPLKWFIVLVLVQSAAAVIKTGNPIVGAIGALSYLAPLPAILLGYYFCRTDRDIAKIIKIYLILSVVMTLSVYLAYAGVNWTVLKQVGEGIFIYSWERGRLDLYSGFLRTPEIAAWHAAAAACLLLLAALAIKGNAVLKCAGGALVLGLLGVILLTGRRKFLVEVVLFVSIYFLLMIWFRGTAITSAILAKSALFLACGLVLGSAAYLYIATDQTTTEIRPYYERGVSVQSDVTKRVEVMTFESFQYVIAHNGILGSGAGTGSQGVQHFGGQSTGAAAEGGLAKVLAELGVPGFLLMIWLVISLGRYVWSILRFVTEAEGLDTSLRKLALGLVAFLITNALVYTIAHQVFGDPFVLIVLGLFLGFVMALPKAVNRRIEERRTGNNRRFIGNREDRDRRAGLDRRDAHIGQWQKPGIRPRTDSPAPVAYHPTSVHNR